jgi:MIP family channel proteins
MRLLSRLLAEFIGTFAVVLIGAGAICADAALRASGSPGLGLLGIAIAQGLAYATMISAMGPISGGHLNPAVSIGFWVTRRLSTFHAILYWAAQLLGGILAARILALLLPESIWRAVSLGAPDVANDLTRAPAMGIEALLTFFVVMVFFLATSRGIEFPRSAGIITGMAFTMGILVGGPFTGAAMNPARVLGPALVSHHWANHGVYWVGPLLGGVLAAWLSDRLFIPNAD